MIGNVAVGVAGLSLALALGVATSGTAQDHSHPHHRAEPNQTTPRDTVRGKVLGVPLSRGGAGPGETARGRRMHGKVMRHRAIRPRMMHGAMAGPALMLVHREALALTPEQVQRLEVLVATQRRALEQLMPEAMRAMADLMAAVSGDIDVDAARAAHDRLARVHSEMMVATLQTMRDARQTLTPEQLTRWDAMIGQMGGMMRMMGPMMGPMMGAGRGKPMR